MGQNFVCETSEKKTEKNQIKIWWPKFANGPNSVHSNMVNRHADAVSVSWSNETAILYLIYGFGDNNERIRATQIIY